MGQDALACLNAVRFPLATEVEDQLGEIQRLTPTIDALLTPDVDAVPGRAEDEAGVLGGVQGSRPLVVRAAALLGVLTLLAVYYGSSESLPDLGLWGDVAFVGLVLIPAFFSLTWLALPLVAGGADGRAGRRRRRARRPRAALLARRARRGRELHQVRRGHGCRAGGSWRSSSR